MTSYLRGLQTFSIDTQASRDEVVAMGYKLQHNERSTLVVQRPDKLRADITGDIRNRTIVYSDARLSMYSPDDAAYVQTSAPATLADLIGTLLDVGVEMPGIDVLYQAMLNPASRSSGSTCNIHCTYCFVLSKEALYPGSEVGSSASQS